MAACNWLGLAQLHFEKRGAAPSERAWLVQVRGEDVDVFLKGGGALDINSVRKKPKVDASASLGPTYLTPATGQSVQAHVKARGLQYRFSA